MQSVINTRNSWAGQSNLGKFQRAYVNQVSQTANRVSKSLNAASFAQLFQSGFEKKKENRAF